MNPVKIVTLSDLRDALRRLNLLANRGRFPLDDYVDKEREVEALAKAVMDKIEELEKLAEEIVYASHHNVE